jgi:hypothetical protein
MKLWATSGSLPTTLWSCYRSQNWVVVMIRCLSLPWFGAAGQKKKPAKNCSTRGIENKRIMNLQYNCKWLKVFSAIQHLPVSTLPATINILGFAEIFMKLPAPKYFSSVFMIRDFRVLQLLPIRFTQRSYTK